MVDGHGSEVFRVLQRFENAAKRYERRDIDLSLLFTLKGEQKAKAIESLDIKGSFVMGRTPTD